MDGLVTVPLDLGEAFRRLVEPRNLGRWMPALTRVQPEPGVVGVPFEVVFDDGGCREPGKGELVICEPPRLAVWRFDTNTDVVVVRLACSRDGGMTRVHIHQDDWAARSPLDVNLTTLQRLLSLDSPEGDQP